MRKPPMVTLREETPSKHGLIIGGASRVVIFNWWAQQPIFHLPDYDTTTREKHWETVDRDGRARHHRASLTVCRKAIYECSWLKGVEYPADNKWTSTSSGHHLRADHAIRFARICKACIRSL